MDISKRTKKAHPISESSCGHSGCSDTCTVRFCGPTSHISHHHAIHTARGVAHIWPAAVVCGLAIVLTTFFANNALQAQTAVETASDADATSSQLQDANIRIDRLEKIIDTL